MLTSRSYPSYDTAKMDQFLSSYYQWFDSDGGQLIEKAFTAPSGYFFSDKRRTVSLDGVIRTRYTVTYPNGKIQRIIDIGDGCHSAAEGDDCGCSKWKARYNN